MLTGGALRETGSGAAAAAACEAPLLGRVEWVGSAAGAVRRRSVGGADADDSSLGSVVEGGYAPPSKGEEAMPPPTHPPNSPRKPHTHTPHGSTPRLAELHCPATP
jgi:hypothetical protein